MVEVRHLDIVPGVFIPATKVKSVTHMADGTSRIYYEVDVPETKKTEAQVEGKKQVAVSAGSAGFGGSRKEK